MVSMYLDIRQAAELLAQVTHRHPIEISQMINHAGQRHGLTFRGPRLNRIEWTANFFWIDEDATGKRFIQPAGYFKNTVGQTIRRVLPGKFTNPFDGGSFVADVHVSIADIVRNPYFKFDEEIQAKILEVHEKNYEPAPAPDDKAATAPSIADNATVKKWTAEKLAELATYRANHTMPETAHKFGISQQRIRELLPRKKPQNMGQNMFKQLM